MSRDPKSIRLPVTSEEIALSLQGLPALDPVLAPLLTTLSLRSSAVLLPLSPTEEGWKILFTRRSQRVSSHKGEISFPGGRVDTEDPSPEATALRETHEEIGVPPSLIRVLGRLPESYSIAGYRIAPIVGEIPASHPFEASSYEIDEIFQVPLVDLLQPGVLRLHHRVEAGPWSHDVYLFDWKPSYMIWGATARILKGFLETLVGPLSAAEDPDDPVPTYTFPFDTGSA